MGCWACGGFKGKILDLTPQEALKICLSRRSRRGCHNNMVAGERALPGLKGGENLGGNLKMAADRKWPHEEVSATKRAQSR